MKSHPLVGQVRFLQCSQAITNWWVGRFFSLWAGWRFKFYEIQSFSKLW